MVSFLTPLALAFGALAIPIILLYMLRLRRTEMPISSTWLWQQLVRDREANAPWQRLRPQWLLFLQLLILAALVMAAARPFTEVKTITTGRIVLLLDASASMNATDVAANRFAAAREIGLDMVDTLGPDDTMTVIRVGAVPEVLAAASRDKLVLRNAIRSARPSTVSADWYAAMTLAAAGAVGVDELKVVIVTDGGLPSDLPPVPGDVRFVSVGREASNLAISALATATLPGRNPELFVRISNYGAQDTDVLLDIRLDGDDVIYTARRFSVPAEGYVDVFDIELPVAFETIEAHLTLPSRATFTDYLAADDTAFAVRDRSGAGRVLLVSENNLFLQLILRSLPGVELFELTPGDVLPRDEYDLYVFDGVLPDELPQGDLFLVNPPHGTDFFGLGDVLQPTEPITVHEEDPRVRNLAGFANTINLSRFRALTDVAWGVALVQTGGWPLVVAGEVGDWQVVILPFDARYPNTDWVLQPAWPILISELAAWFSPPQITNVTDSLPPGTPVTIRLIENADEAVITHPDGRRVGIPAEASEVAYADTLMPGLYRVDLRRDGDTFKSERFAVNLFDARESRIEPETSVVIGTTTVSRSSRQETGRREFWPWILGISPIMLALEWWIYHRSLRRVPRVALAGLRRERAPQKGWRATLSRRLRRSR